LLTTLATAVPHFQLATTDGEVLGARDLVGFAPVRLNVPLLSRRGASVSASDTGWIVQP
jgi:hypothetical protein